MYGRDQYQQAATHTASPAQLVLMLFDGALVRLEVAQDAIAEGRIGQAHEAIVRVQAIVDELQVSLDHDRGGSIAANLASLYAYCTRLLLEGNVRKDTAPLAEVAGILQGLRDAWDLGVVRGGSVAVAG
ncbi:MAG: flagellar export chaperone FliS [Nitriliruptoraceae bacterium]